MMRLVLNGQYFGYLQHTPEWQIFVFVFLGMLLCVGLAEFFRAILKLSPEFSRKFVHVSIGLIIFFLPNIIVHALPMLVLGFIFILVNSAALRMEWLAGMHGTDRHSLGTVLYPVSFVLLVFFFWDRHPEIPAIAMLVMALGDGFAAIIGGAVRSPHFYILSSDKKSIEGSAAMFIVSFMCVLGGLKYYAQNELSWPALLQASFVIAFTAASWEGLSSGGWDNFSVPVSSGLLLACFLIPETGILPKQVFIAAVFAICIAAVSWRAKFLSISGAVATALLAVVIFGIGGW
jgi:dolichol kinase